MAEVAAKAAEGDGVGGRGDAGDVWDGRGDAARAFDFWGLAPGWLVVVAFEMGSEGARQRIVLEDSRNELRNFTHSQIDSIVREFQSRASSAEATEWSAYQAIVMTLKHGDTFDQGLVAWYRVLASSHTNAKCQDQYAEMYEDSLRWLISGAKDKLAESATDCKLLADVCSDPGIRPAIRASYLEWLSSSLACDGFGLVDDAIAQCERDPDTALHEAAFVARQRVEAGRAKGR